MGVADCVGVGQVTLGIEQLGQNRDPLIDRFTLKFVLSAFDEVSSTPFEDSANELWILFLYVFEEFDRELTVGVYEQ